jgi:hypothetical protein
LIRTVKNAQALAAGICLPHVCISGKLFSVTGDEAKQPIMGFAEAQ